jgi:hypothetical protein
VTPAFQARISISALTAMFKFSGSKLAPREKSSIGVLSPRFAFLNDLASLPDLVVLEPFLLVTPAGDLRFTLAGVVGPEYFSIGSSAFPKTTMPRFKRFSSRLP